MSLELLNITKKFEGKVAVDNIDLDVNPKEMLFLLGPSGCGKTTTLRIIAGLERQDKGRVLIEGKDVSDLPPHKRGVAMVFQTWALFPHKKVFDNVAFGLKMKKMPRNVIKEKVKEALELVNLSGLEDKYPAQLSGGEQQRVALARALVIEPTVLLLDEPLSNLDYNLRLRMRSEIKGLQRKSGITTIFVTHDQIEALTMADRIAVMNSGRICETGTPIELFEKPKDEFTLRFIGEKNILIGSVIEEAGESIITVRTSRGLNLKASVELYGERERLCKGDEVIMAINPWDINVLRSNASSDTTNLLVGVIRSIEYRGYEIMYEVEVKNELLKVRMNNPKGNFSFSHYEKVYLKINPESINVIPRARKSPKKLENSNNL